MNAEKLIGEITIIKEESEEFLEQNGTNYEEVLKNKDSTEYSEQSENNNFEAGIISACNKIEKIIKELK